MSEPKHVGFFLPQQDAAVLRELAERDDRTLSSFLRALVRPLIDRERKRWERRTPA